MDVCDDPDPRLASLQLRIDVARGMEVLSQPDVMEAQSRMHSIHRVEVREAFCDDVADRSRFLLGADT